MGSRKAATVPELPGRGLTTDALHFLAALPRMDGGSETGDLADATRAVAEEVRTFWPGPAAPPVRLLPKVLPVADLEPPKGQLAVSVGLDEQRLAPVWHDFEATPHLLVFGDSECGKSSFLRHVLKGLVQRHMPNEARTLPRISASLLGAAETEHVIGYAASSTTLTPMIADDERRRWTKRPPGPNLTAEELRNRTWVGRAGSLHRCR